MSSANNGMIVGTIVSDIVQRQPNDQLAVTQFRVAPADARKEDSPIPLTAYNGIGTNIVDKYNQGDLVSISYRLRYQTWQDQEGKYLSRMEVVVTSITTIRLGKISTAKRAEAAAGTDKPAEPQLSILEEAELATL
jgi:single-stranded DNA-binding protein